jgi:hypothetical protein
VKTPTTQRDVKHIYLICYKLESCGSSPSDHSQHSYKCRLALGEYGLAVKNRGLGTETHMYCILLLKLETMLSGCQRKTYMTNAHDKLANAGQAFLCSAFLV